jgi:hypothetical protein
VPSVADEAAPKATSKLTAANAQEVVATEELSTTEAATKLTAAESPAELSSETTAELTTPAKAVAERFAQGSGHFSIRSHESVMALNHAVDEKRVTALQFCQWLRISKPACHARFSPGSTRDQPGQIRPLAIRRFLPFDFC